MRAYLWLVLIGCGDNIDDVDTALDCSNQARAVPFATTVLGPLFGTQVQVSFPAAQGGNLILMALSHGVPISPPGAVAQSAASLGGCSELASVWSFGNVRAGMSTASVQVTSAEVPLFVHVLEFAGLSRDAGTSFARIDGGEFNTPLTAQAPALQACSGDLVVSTMVTCDAITDLEPDSPFTSATTGQFAVAFYVPEVEGSYGASWTYDGVTWAGNTVVFH